jgi:hypothetical protein
MHLPGESKLSADTTLVEGVPVVVFSPSYYKNQKGLVIIPQEDITVATLLDNFGWTGTVAIANMTLRRVGHFIARIRAALACG